LWKTYDSVFCSSLYNSNRFHHTGRRNRWGLISWKYIWLDYLLLRSRSHTSNYIYWLTVLSRLLWLWTAWNWNRLIPKYPYLLYYRLVVTFNCIFKYTVPPKHYHQHHQYQIVSTHTLQHINQQIQTIYFPTIFQVPKIQLIKHLVNHFNHLYYSQK